LKKRSKSLAPLLILSLFLTFALPVHAQSITGEVYSDFQIVDLAVKVTSGDKQLTVTFPQKFSEEITADSFEITIQKTTEAKLSAPVKIAASSITTGSGSYTFKNLTNKLSYTIQVTAYTNGEIVAGGSGTGVPASVALPKIERIVASGGDSSVKITFIPLTGKGPYSYKIQYWTQKDKNGNPIILSTIAVNTNAGKLIPMYEFKMLKNGTTYHFNVLAETDNVIVAITSDVTATPKAKEKKK
jgi:hypothetical protein